MRECLGKKYEGQQVFILKIYLKNWIRKRRHTVEIDNSSKSSSLSESSSNSDSPAYLTPGHFQC